MPLTLATSSIVTIDSNPLTVALTKLIGVLEPKHFEITFVTPANSKTALTGPPAITPVPVAAGRNTTLAAP